MITTLDFKLAHHTLGYFILNLALLLSSCAPVQIPEPTPTLMPTPATFTNPVLDQDFPDPDVLEIGDVYYAYATNANDDNIQSARSTDLVDWEMLGDVLPTLPDWAVQSFGSVWAPEVFSPGDG